MRGRTDTEWGVDLAPDSAFKFLGGHITRIPDVEYPFPEWELREIWKFDPGYIPITRKLLFKSQAGAVYTFRHFGVARFDPSPEDPENINPTIVNLPKPTVGPLAKLGPANIIDIWFENQDMVRPGTPRWLNNLPPPTVYPETWILPMARESYWEADAETKKRVRAQQDAEAEDAKIKAQEERDAEADYVNKGEAQYRQKLYDQLSPEDEKEFLARRAGLYKEDAKPFADYGHRRSA
jgi:hypothetical protein